MVEKLSNNSSCNNTMGSVLRSIAIASLIVTLNGCTSPDSKIAKRYERQTMQMQDRRIKRQEKKVHKLEGTLKQQGKDYDNVAIQQNRQQDLKEQGADATINQEIGYALDRGNEQDAKIANTKRKLKNAQDRLLDLKEHQNVPDTAKTQENQPQQKRMKIGKYGYIEQEYEH